MSIKEFLNKSFEDMKENTKIEGEIARTNFEAAKAESKAKFEEGKFQNTLKKAKEESRKNFETAKKMPSEVRKANRKKQEERLAEANARKEKALKKLEK